MARFEIPFGCIPDIPTSPGSDGSVGKKHFKVVFRTASSARLTALTSFSCLAFEFKVNRRHSTGSADKPTVTESRVGQSRRDRHKSRSTPLFLSYSVSLLASIYGRGPSHRIVDVPIRYAYTSRTWPNQSAFVAWQVSHIPISVISTSEQRTENVLIDRLCRNQQRLTVAFVE
jgi:hypothetical protein